MNAIDEIRGDLIGNGRRFGIVAARFNDRIGGALVRGAVDGLRRHGVAAEDIHVVTVPGAWEVPQGLAALAARGTAAGPLHGLIALGVVIRGETPHFDFLCREATAGIARAGERAGLPVAYGLLTCDTSEQAVERAGGKAGNKGWEAALAVLEMADLMARLGETPATAASPATPATPASIRPTGRRAR